MIDPDAQEAPETIEPHVLPILIWPDKRLHIKGENITTFDMGTRQIVLDLVATMKANEGAGLAAPQVGISANIIVIEIEPGKLLVLINPEYIIKYDNEMFEWEEGCLSVPGYFEKRKRPHRILVKYQDLDGKEKETEFEGLYAFAVQHEMDHLEGKVFVDGASFFKRNRIKDKVTKNKIKKWLIRET